MVCFVSGQERQNIHGAAPLHRTANSALLKVFIRRTPPPPPHSNLPFLASYGRIGLHYSPRLRTVTQCPSLPLHVDKRAAMVEWSTTWHKRSTNYWPWSKVPPWEGNRSSASQEIRHILRNPKVHYRIHLSLSWARSIQPTSSHPISSSCIFILPFHLRLGLRSSLFPSCFATKTLCAQVLSAIIATLSAPPPQPIPLDFITRWEANPKYSEKQQSQCHSVRHKSHTERHHIEVSLASGTVR